MEEEEEEEEGEEVRARPVSCKSEGLLMWSHAVTCIIVHER